MKKITLLFILLLTSFTLSYGQCTTIGGGNYPAGLINMLNDGTVQTISNDNWGAGEYTAMTGFVAGNTYTVSGSNLNGIYITVAEIDWNAPALGGTVLGNGATTVTFTATTPDIIIHWHLDSLCSETGNEDTVTTIQCTSAVCSCTAASAPDAAVAASPLNGATDVPIDATDPANLAVGPFSWTDNGEATAYQYTLVGVATIGANNPITITYSWEYNTTYSWEIISTNCLGTMTSSTFTFTTQMDPALSVDEFENTTFSVFPNPAKDTVTIKTDLTIDSIEVINMLGQRVKMFEGNTIVNNTVNISSLNNGLYFLNVNAEGKSQSIRIIKE